MYGDASKSRKAMREIDDSILSEQFSTMPMSPTRGEFGFVNIGTYDPRYSKYSRYITGHTVNPEAVADDLQSNKEMWRNAAKGFAINLLAGALDSFWF